MTKETSDNLMLLKKFPSSSPMVNVCPVVELTMLSAVLLTRFLKYWVWDRKKRPTRATIITMKKILMEARILLRMI